MLASWNFQKADRTLLCRQKIHHFFFSHTWGTCLKYLPKGIPYILMYSTLHIMQWFSQILDVFTPKIRRKFLDFHFYKWKQMSLSQNLKWSLEWRSALQLQRQTDLLLCTTNFFLRWAHPQNMAVGNLDFHHTLYLRTEQNCYQGSYKGESVLRAILLSHMEGSYCTSKIFVSGAW